MRLDVVDRPGVLAQVAAALAEHEVSIEAVRQSLAPHPDSVPGDPVAHLVITTHSATDAALAATVEAVAALADHDVSIEAVRQSLAPHPDSAPGDPVAHLVITTHSATDAALSATVDAVAGLDVVLAVRSVLRVEGS